MPCSQCDGIETLFDQKTAQQDLRDYRKNGPSKTTRWLLDGLKAAGVNDLTLMDIGGGVGVIPNELLRAGVREATDVDASTAYIETAKQEALRQSHAERLHFYHGNFVTLAPELPPADIVTLDRVICCFDDMESLVELSSARARKLYAVVFPRDTWWLKLGVQFINLICRLQRNPFRSYVHPTEQVKAIVRRNGLKLHTFRQTLVWQVMIFAREARP
jgi:predicted TPR repeat methyltransferase